MLAITVLLPFLIFGSTCGGVTSSSANAEDIKSDMAASVAQAEAENCYNGARDGVESDVDCGGRCSSNQCTYGRGCRTDEDCAGFMQCKQASPLTSTCFDSRCLPDHVNHATGTCSFTDPAVTCVDGVQNQYETCVDGGGTECRREGQYCPAQQGCVADADCLGAMYCHANICVSCTGGQQDGTETDVDCGGPVCSPCQDNQVCSVDADCLGRICYQPTGRCVSHGNGVKDGSETCVDGGGPTAPRRCNVYEDCLQGTDCYSGICEQPYPGHPKSCQPPNASITCQNSIRDGLETCLDGGGSVCRAVHNVPPPEHNYHDQN
jgi:hypothetical protein